MQFNLKIQFEFQNNPIQLGSNFRYRLGWGGQVGWAEVDGGVKQTNKEN